MAVVLVFNQRVLHKASQQSVHPTCGILRHFQAFFWLWVFSTSQALSTPAHTRVTQAVGKNLHSSLNAVSKIKLVFKLAFWVLQIRVWVFSKVSASIKSGAFSGGSFQNFIGFKIGSWFWFKTFRVKLAQVSKIGFVVFSQYFGKQAVSFGKIRFSWLAFCLARSSFWNRLQDFQQKFWKVWFWLLRRVHFFWQSNFLVRSVFSKGFSKFSALAFFQVCNNFQNKVGLVKNCGACKIKSVKAVFCFLASESC